MKYWIGVASREHVIGGVQGGFAQVCHGKKGPLSLMKKDDWMIYYSPTITFRGEERCQSFTAIGRVLEGAPYAFSMSPDFIPYRRDVRFYDANETSIIPMIDQLMFIQDKKRWGFPFRRGCFSIPEIDFRLIAGKMLKDLPPFLQADLVG